MADIIHRIGIKKSAAQVYAALSTIEGLAGWWTKDTTGTSTVGGSIVFTFKTLDGKLLGEMAMDVLKLDPDKQVHWRVKSGPPEWIGTDITFDLSSADGMTILLFGHRNWRDPKEFMAHCSMKWAVFLLSLRDLVETGKGKPSPVDVKIDNWN
jgi:uncharacterized protein YndB with AHSA1/START domain